MVCRSFEESNHISKNCFKTAFLDPSAVLPVRDSVKGKVSWTDGDVTFFVHIVDRTSVSIFKLYCNKTILFGHIFYLLLIAG